MGKGLLKNVAGVTLLEAMASIFIFAIVIVGVLALFTQSQRAALEAKYYYIAANLAKNHLERLRATPYELLADSAETDSRLDENGKPAGAEGMFVRNTTVYTGYLASGEEYASGDLTEVTVSVAYDFRGQRKSPVTISTLFLQRP